jgi:hypothetical protein
VGFKYILFFRVGALCFVNKASSSQSMHVSPISPSSFDELFDFQSLSPKLAQKKMQEKEMRTKLSFQGSVGCKVTLN